MTVVPGVVNNAGKDGYQPLGTVFGHLFVDTDGNGAQNGAEPNLTERVGGDHGRAGCDADSDIGRERQLHGDGAGRQHDMQTWLTATLPAGYAQTAGVDPSTVNVPSGSVTSIFDDGYQPRGTVFGHLFVDTDGNGAQNGAEPNLSGVSVVITDALGVTRTVTSDASGNYTATVPAGSTTADVVEATLPVGYAQTAGVDPSTVNVPSGSVTSIFDDGYQPRGTVTGTVFRDDDGNGVQNGAEPGIPSVSVVITDALGVTRTVTTDANGVYTATNVPSGTANVDVVNATLPAGVVQTAGVDPSSVTVVPGVVNNAGKDGYQPLGTVFGHLFVDTDGNGAQNGAEPNLSGVSVVITDALGVTRTVTSDASGNYTATVPAGSTTADVVEATLPTGYAQTAGVDPSTVNVPSGSVTSIFDDGYQPRGTVIGTVFRDDDGNGVQNGAEPGIPSVSVVITDALGVTRTVTTDASGVYTATNVPSGAAMVDVVNATLPAGVVQTAGTDPSSVTVVPGVVNNAGKDGYQPLGTVFGHLFVDTDGNGAQNGAEPNLSGVSVVITDALGVTQTVTSDASGNYTATVPAGSTTADVVEATLPVGYTQTAGVDSSTVNVPSGSVTSIFDDGYQPRGTVVGTVFRDDDGNGVQNGAEPGIPSVSVVITDALGVTRTVTTDANGVYTATNVPSGTANVDVVNSTLPAGYVDTTLVDPSSVTVSPGVVNNAGKDGYQPQAAVFGHLFVDTDGNGAQNGAEPNLSGVSVVITDALGVTRTVTSDASGNYTATVPAGSTTADVVEATLPAGYAQTAGSDPSTVTAPAITVTNIGSDGYQPRGTVTGTCSAMTTATERRTERSRASQACRW